MGGRVLRRADNAELDSLVRLVGTEATDVYGVVHRREQIAGTPTPRRAVMIEDLIDDYDDHRQDVDPDAADGSPPPDRAAAPRAGEKQEGSSWPIGIDRPRRPRADAVPAWTVYR